jgi:hypothetical protein
VLPSLPGFGSYWKEQVPPERVQLGEEKLPWALDEKPTVPVGVVCPPRPESMTVTWQPVIWFAEICDGEHWTEVKELLLPNKIEDVPLLAWWSISPA